MYETMTIDGHTLAYKHHNKHIKKTPIVYIHGILNSIHSQEVPLSEILQDEQWISLSLPGHYPAQLSDDFQRDDLTPEFFGQILSKSIQEIVGDAPVCMMGHSTGGFASMAIAHEAPDLVESICLVDAFAHGYWYSLALRPMQIIANLPILQKPLFMTYVRFIRGNPLAIHIFLNAINHDYRAIRKNPNFKTGFQAIVNESKYLNGPALYPYFHHMPRIDILPWLSAMNISVTLIHGDNDPVILPKHAEAMHSQLPNSQLIWLKDCGHDPFTETFDELKQAILAWTKPN